MAVKNPSLIPVSELTAKQAKAEHARLTAEIAQHDKRYYQQDRPSVSDAEYDALRARYNAIEARFPDLRTLESLSLKVGAAPSGRFRKVRHALPMLSLDNAFSEEDVTRFAERIRRFLKLSADELAKRKSQWKARESEYGSGYLWKYAQQVGPAVNGAVTHPGGAGEKECYADI